MRDVVAFIIMQTRSFPDQFICFSRSRFETFHDYSYSNLYVFQNVFMKFIYSWLKWIINTLVNGSI